MSVQDAVTFGLGYSVPAMVLTGLGFGVAGPVGGSIAASIQSKQL